jgi:hypothetical protein
MLLIPFRRFNLQTPLDLDKAVTLLSNETQPSRTFWPKPFSEKRYVGMVGREGFRIKKTSQLWNSTVWIKGRFQSATETTKVEIKICVKPLDLIFVIAWAVVAFLLFWVPSRSASKPWLILGGLVAALIGYMFSVLHFAADMQTERSYLSDLFLHPERHPIPYKWK